MRLVFAATPNRVVISLLNHNWERVGGNDADYALIQDFELSKSSRRSSIPGDHIQLNGKASDYTLAATPVGILNGVGIYTSDAKHDLVGIVQGQGVNLSNLSLTNTSEFTFVS